MENEKYILTYIIKHNFDMTIQDLMSELMAVGMAYTYTHIDDDKHVIANKLFRAEFNNEFDCESFEILKINKYEY
jgi:hypothetical protein